MYKVTYNIGVGRHMTRTLSIAEARERLTRLPEEFAAHPDEGALSVTRRGEPVLAVLPWETYEALIETMEIMGDPDLWADLRAAAQDLASGKTVSLDDLEAQLGI
jgi:antitoxin YefM